MSAAEYRKILESRKAESRLLGQQIEEERERLESLEADRDSIEKARALIQQSALQTQETVRTWITGIGTTALRAIWTGKELELSAEFAVKRGRTEVQILVGEDGEFSDPLSTHGGSVVDVAGFALRAAFWSIARTRPVLILDEPLKFLSKDQRVLGADMMKMVAERLGLQIILVTNEPEFEDIADRLFHVERRGNVSSVRTV